MGFSHKNTYTFARCSGIERRAIAVLAMLCLAFSLLYGYFVTTSIVNVLARKELEHRIAQLHSDIGQLESAYLSRTNDIDMQYAQAVGFIAVSDTAYVTRQPLAQSAALSRTE